jgi:RimJ/RimL family protein N-acetyltransferase
MWQVPVWPVDPTTVLRGELVELSVSKLADAPELFVALNSDSVWQHVAGRPRTVEDMEKLISFKLDEATWNPWTVRLIKDYKGIAAGSIVGTTSYLETFPSEGRTEIGSTTYAPEVWGSLVNPECKLLLLQFAFESMLMSRVQLKTDIRNQRSQQAIARLGASFEGVLRLYQRRQDGTMRDTVLFSIIKDEWPEVRERLQERLKAE